MNAAEQIQKCPQYLPHIYARLIKATHARNDVQTENSYYGPDISQYSPPESKKIFWFKYRNTMFSMSY